MRPSLVSSFTPPEGMLPTLGLSFLRTARALACCAGPLAFAAAAQSPPAAPLSYPPAAPGAVVDDYHGTAVSDPYRWLEDLDSPETRAFVAAEAKLTGDYLAAKPAREALRRRLGRLYDYERIGVPFHEHGRYFYTRNSGLQDQSVLLAADGATGTPAVALDPNTLSADGSLAVVGYVASRDGRLLAYGVSVSGSDWTEWHVRDLASGRDLSDVLRYTKYYRPSFSNDGRGLYYSAFAAPRPGEELSARDLGDALYYHALGSAAADDRRLLARDDHPDWQFSPSLSDDGRWLIVTAGEGEVGDKGVNNVYLLDLASAAPVAVPVAEGFDAAYVYVGSDRGRIYFLTTLGAPNGRVIAIDPARPERANWRSVIAEGSEAISITDPSVTLVGHRLIVQTLYDAHSRVRVYGLDGKLHREVVLPGVGTTSGFDGRPGDSETFYSFTDLVTPPTVYRYDLASGQSRVFRAPTAPFDRHAFEARQVFYRGKDGTRIPMLLAYRKGLQLDGTNPLLLYGYGGFAIPILPTFSPARIAWLERGGVYAIANIRGGGEYGDRWHRQAIREHKQVVFDDFIAAAEWLIRERYTSTPRLAIIGGSNGGLLVGACVTQRPELYGAAVAQVGVMDMLRFDRFGQGAGWTGEYGSPQDPAGFRALYAYSPLHRVRPGVRYPATLIVTGDHDTRVMPMHSFKFAAALQAAQAGPAPILLDIERSSGHGGGPTISQAIEQNADIYTFLIDTLGMPPK